MPAPHESWLSRIKRFFGFSPSNAVDAARPDVASVSIADFRTKTAMGLPAQAESMGWLKDAGVSPQEFADYCAGFARGVEYVKQKYGTEPVDIVITDAILPDSLGTTYYEHASKKVVISRQFIKEVIQTPKFRQRDTDPL